MPTKSRARDVVIRTNLRTAEAKAFARAAKRHGVMRAVAMRRFVLWFSHADAQAVQAWLAVARDSEDGRHG